jgi:hypothetical protein
MKIDELESTLQALLNAIKTSKAKADGYDKGYRDGIDRAKEEVVRFFVYLEEHNKLNYGWRYEICAILDALRMAGRHED